MVLSACGVDLPQAGAGAASTASAERNQGGWTLDVIREKGGAGAADPWQFMNFANVVAAGPNDQVLFLERFGNRLTVFDRAGALVRRIGGVGPGPGEFSAPYSAGTHPDGDIWVSESFKGYYHVFDSTGVLRHTVPRPMRAVSAYGAPIRFDGGGRLIDIDIGGRVSVVHVEPASGEVAGYGPSAEEPPPPSVFGVLRPNSAQRAVSGRLLPRRRWAITPDGGLWSGLSTGGTVEWLGPDGALGRTLLLHNAEPAFTPEEEELVERAKRELRASDVGARPQTIQAIIPFSDGRVLVQVPDPLNEPGTRFELFGPDDRWIGTVDAQVALHPRTSPLVLGDTIIGVTLDSLDVPVLVWMVLRRGT